MRRKNSTAVIEQNDKGVSAAGEVVLFGAIATILLTGGLLWGGYTLITFLWRESVALFGRGFVVGAMWVVPSSFAMLGFYALAGRVAIWLETHNATNLQAQFVQPNEAGLLPVNQRFIETTEGSAAALQLAIASQRAKWTVADVPHSLTYAPKYNNRQDIQGGEQAAPQLTVTPQNFWQLYSGGALPDNGFLMGYSLETNEAVNADWSKLYSALIGGQSGSGKSTLIRSILAQSALQGGRFLVLDPHFGAGEESLGASLQPLRHLMLADVASDEKQMLDSIAYIRDIGQRRLTGRDSDRTPVILVVDETTALLQRSTAADALTDALGEISQETRKVGVYGLCIGQNFSAEVMPTTVRNSFVSFISCRARRDVARVMTSDNEFGKAAQKLQTGQAVWMTPGGEMWTLAVPNCTQHDLELVASHTANGEQWHVVGNGSPPPVSSGSHGGSRSGSQVVHNAERVNQYVNQLGTTQEPPCEPGKLARIEHMRADGIGINEIIRTVFQVQGKGKAWMQARKELQEVIDYLEAKA